MGTEQVLDDLRKHASEPLEFLSNRMKPERERAVCRAFLRTLGELFDEQELVAPSEEPADVTFRTARFQIREILEFGRKRGDEWKEKESKYSKANSLNDLGESYSSPTELVLSELVSIIADALAPKAQKYGMQCNDTDALVYVNLKKQFLSDTPTAPNLGKLKLQGWRSVSILFPPYGIILFTAQQSPDFLEKLSPGKYKQWDDIYSLFEAH